MGDMREIFDDHRKHSRYKRESNMMYSSNKLTELGISFESKNNGIHLIVNFGCKIADFYPSTGKYKFRDCGYWRRGLNKMIKEGVMNHG